MIELLNVSVKTEGGKIDLNFSDDLKFTAENLNDAYIDQPSKFAYWSALAIQSKSLLDRKKLEVERFEEYMKKTLIGELDAEVRNNMSMEGERITEARVTGNIYTHPRYLSATQDLYKLQDELLELQAQTNTLNLAKEAFLQRKDMIISLGANIRQEKVSGI